MAPHAGIEHLLNDVDFTVRAGCRSSRRVCRSPARFTFRVRNPAGAQVGAVGQVRSGGVLKYGPDLNGDLVGWASLFGRELQDPCPGLVDTAADAPGEQSGGTLDDQIGGWFRRPGPALELSQRFAVRVSSLHRLTTLMSIVPPRRP